MANLSDNRSRRWQGIRSLGRLLSLALMGLALAASAQANQGDLPKEQGDSVKVLAELSQGSMQVKVYQDTAGKRRVRLSRDSRSVFEASFEHALRYFGDQGARGRAPVIAALLRSLDEKTRAVEAPKPRRPWISIAQQPEALSSETPFLSLSRAAQPPLPPAQTSSLFYAAQPQRHTTPNYTTDYTNYVAAKPVDFAPIVSTATGAQAATSAKQVGRGFSLSRLFPGAATDHESNAAAQTAVLLRDQAGKKFIAELTFLRLGSGDHDRAQPELFLQGPDGRKYRIEIDWSSQRAAVRSLTVGSEPPSAKTKTPGRHTPQASGSPDERLESAIRGALRKLQTARRLSRFVVHIAVADGVVTLSGQVANRKQRRRIQKTVKSVEGVVSVRNQLTIRSVQTQP